MKTSLFITCLTLALGLLVLLSSPMAQAEEKAMHPLAKHYKVEHTPNQKKDPKGLGGLARAMNDPTGNVWQLQMEFDTVLQKGDITDGDYKTQYQLEIQPIIPIPLTKDWNFITRPVIPIVSSEIPQLSLSGVDFDRKTGLGDIELPLMFSPNNPKRNWGWGLGPTFTFPSATKDELGSEKWQAGPVAAFVYKPKKAMMGILGQYWWDFAGDDDRSSVSHADILPFLFYSLPNQFEIGYFANITYDHLADSGNKWNVPVGLMVGRLFEFGKVPVKIDLGGYYSAVHADDDISDRWTFQLVVTPVIKGLIKNPLFGGK